MHIAFLEQPFIPRIVPLIREIGVPGLFDIGLMSVVLYAVLLWFKKRRAAFVLFGIMICGVFYLLAHEFHLILISTVLQAFFAVILVALIIIFQEELKSFFEQIAVWSLNRKFGRRESLLVPHKVVDILVHTLTDLSEQQIGALVVLQGKAMLDRHVTGGFGLNGELSEPLLKSIFDPHSVGHDGAVIIEGDRLTRFGGQLPLAKTATNTRKGGMRHAAALGLSELTDALCLVVSEETGAISAAWHGEFQKLGDVGEAGQLRHLVEEFCEQTAPLKKRSLFADIFLKNYREKGAAIFMTLFLWYVVVHESRVIHKTFAIPVEYSQTSADLSVDSIEPKEVHITFSGPRHTFQFLDPSDVRAVLRLHDYGEGTWALPLNESNVTGPKETVLEEIDPNLIMVEIEKK